MSRNHLPPDQDPELRRAFALDADAQEALLRRMCGEAPRPSTAFRAVPITTKRTPKGGLACIPAPFPDDVVMTDQSTVLQIVIDNRAFRRRTTPRTPEGVTAMEKAIQDAGPKRGVFSQPFQPPVTWSLKTVRQVIGLMLDRLPHAESHTGKFWVGMCVCQQRFNELGAYALTVRPYTTDFEASDGPYTAKVHFAKDVAVAAFREWWRLIPHEGDWEVGGPLEGVDKALAQAPPPPAPQQPSEVRDAHWDDDELDAIERAARRTLHGQAPSAFKDTNVYAKIRLLEQRDRRYVQQIELLVDHLLRDLN